MCTATWLATGDELLLLFNRDERRSRPAGLPPRAGERDGRRFLAPIDGAAGGTWIAVNELGLILALLNRSAEGAEPSAGRESRGTIVANLAGASALAEVERRLGALALGRFVPFRLVARSLHPAAMLCLVWDGTALAREELDAECGILCSSSLGDERVTRVRTPLWRRLFVGGGRPEPAALREFQRSHDPERSADSVCMHREDARTVSQVEIRIDARQAEMIYRDGSPCESTEATSAHLELAR